MTPGEVKVGELSAPKLKVPELKVPELKVPVSGAEAAKGAVSLAASVLETAPKRRDAAKPPTAQAKAAAEVSPGSALIAGSNVALLLGVPLASLAAIAYIGFGPK